MITAKEDPVVFELTSTLREWHQIWISLYLDNQQDLFERVGTIIIELIDSRAELIELLESSKNNKSQDATNREPLIADYKTEIVNKLDLGNRLLGLDLVPRDSNFRPVDPVELSPVRLYQLHNEAASNQSGGTTSSLYGYQECSANNAGSTLSTISQISSESGSTNVSQQQSTISYHLQLNLKSQQITSLPPDEVFELYFSIIEITSNTSLQHEQFKPITEKYLVQIQNDQLLCGVSNTVFTNIGPTINRELCLLIQAYRVGRMLVTDGHKTAFGKQLSGHNLNATSIQEVSISNTNKYQGNGLSRSRHSTIGFFNGLSKLKRPVGVSFVLLKDHFKSANASKESNISIRIQSTSESDFSNLAELFSKRGMPSKSSQNGAASINLNLSLKYLIGPHELLPKLTKDVPCCLTEKRGFPDIIMPGDFKNDLYLYLDSAEFEKGGKSISKNIEASISLINKSGMPIDGCISPGSNCDNVPCYKSCVFYHSNSPRWFESIKINVPLIEFDSAHIRIEFRHCSTKDREKKFLGFSFLPLSDEDGTVIADNAHDLYLYKCDPQIWEDETLNLSKYTSLPYGPAAKVQSNCRFSQQQNFTHSSRELISVRTFLLSTKLTQNSNLLNLLKWRELVKRNNKDFEEALKKVLVLTGEEIVQFLQDILDTLFDTFTLFLTSEDDYTALIFKVLVHIFLLLDEPKYQHFKPVLDTYASAHFSATLVYKGLLACVKRCLEYSSMVEKHAAIQRCFKSIRYVFQFIVQSKLLYSKATGEQSDEAFLNDLRHLFKQFEAMLANPNPKLIPVQVTFLESFPGTLAQLIKVINAQELARFVTSLAGSVGFNLPPALSRAKLIFMKETANSELIKNQEIRKLITDNFCRHLDYFIRHTEELELCHEVLEILIVKIHDYHWPVIHRLHQLTCKSGPQESVITKNPPITTVGEINVYINGGQIQANQLDLAIISVTKELEPFVNLMEPLLYLLEMLVKDFNTDCTIVQIYCTCLLTILKLMSRANFEQFMKQRKMDYPKLCNLFRTFRAVYNRDWSVMQLTSHSILEHPISELSKDIKNDSAHANKQLSYKNLAVTYIRLIVDFITHPTLQLEAFSERKKNYILGAFSDLRLKYGNQLMQFWNDLSRSSRTQTIYDLIPTSIQAFLDASMLQNEELQRKLIPVFWDMIDADDKFKTRPQQIERCMIDNLDLFMNLDRGTNSFVENFDSILTNMIKEKNPTWEDKGLSLISSFTRLMRLLINYRSSLDCSENRSKQMCCLVDLLNYYKDQNRMDIHLRYLFKLCDMHIEANNHCEAAFTLKMYADKTRWSTNRLCQLEGYRPEEDEWRRKEALYLKIIHYFDIGKCWEETIPLCKELASFYENFLIDYEKVSSTLKKLAQFLDFILTEHRPEREYFRVEFLGSQFPEYIRDKELIYRGGEYERLPTFIQRMTSEFPEAQIVQNKGKQSISKDSVGQFMVISNVKPVPSLQDHLKSSQRKINDKIIQYFLNNRLDTFSYDVPIIKGKEKSASDSGNVKNLWVGRYLLKTKKELPDIIPWSEVISKEYMEISPINHAIETISAMNFELSKLVLSYSNEPNKQISPLTMRLQGVIEAAVNGGPSLFINAFLKRQPNDTGERQEPELLNRLRDLIKQQFSLLEAGLALHSKLAPPEVMPLHNRLVERLQGTRKSLLEETSLIENNYEVIKHPTPQIATTAISPITISSPRPPSDAMLQPEHKDEVDGHDMNGNPFVDGEDQIYQQPNDSKPHRTTTNGSKSELSSPSRGHICNNSSSLSRLAVLSNLPVNRSRISLTPSKDPSLHHPDTLLLHASNTLCARASRKLNYDSTSSQSTRGSPQPNGKSSDEAPPLPPRTFIQDRIGASRTLNRSPFTGPSMSSNPSHGKGNSSGENSTKHAIDEAPNKIGAVPNQGVLSAGDANKLIQSIDLQGPPPVPGKDTLPSSLPRSLATRPASLSSSQQDSSC